MAAQPTMRRRLLGLELRTAREKVKLEGQETARRLGWHPSKLTRIETGRSGVSVQDVRALLDLYEVKDESLRDELERIARLGRQRTWWQPYSDVLSRQYVNLIALESEATAVRNYELALVPGLLQTPDYARTITRALTPDGTNDAVNTLVDVKMQRQARAMSREEPLRLWAIVDESAIRRVVGSPEIMRRQLASLLDASERPNITVQVLTSGGHLGLLGSWAILEFPIRSDLDVVYVESQAGSHYLERSEDVAAFDHKYNLLRAGALGVPESRRLISKIMKDRD